MQVQVLLKEFLQAKRLILVIGLAFLLIASTINGQCNVCSGFNNLACVSQTEFQVCVDGTPAGDIVACPTGYVCSTSTGAICQLNQNGVIVTCGDCNVCDQTGTFACTGPQTYALCLGTTTPSMDLTGSCAPNHICDIGSQQICVNINAGTAPTCGTGGITTTVAPSVIDPLLFPQQYCRQVQQYGRFSVGFNATSTCRQYVFCWLRGGIWSGALYTCPGRLYFNSSSRLCQDGVPANCF